MRTQWLREELMPFIAPIATGASGVESLLLKHARGVRARWSATHANVLLRGEMVSAGGDVPCTLYQARVKYS